MSKQLSDGDDSGTVLGQSDSDPIAFFGATATARPASTTAVSSTAIASNGSNSWGLSTSTQGDAMIALVRAMHANLISLGLKGS
jgi:hypothetical protein